MKDKLLFGTIGLLVRVVVMQTMPSVPANAGTVSAEHLAALAGPGHCDTLRDELSPAT